MENLIESINKAVEENKKEVKRVESYLRENIKTCHENVKTVQKEYKRECGSIREEWQSPHKEVKYKCEQNKE